MHCIITQEYPSFFAPHVILTPMEIELEKWSHGGESLAFIDGKPLFVPGGVPGDVVQVRVISEKKQYRRALIESVLAAGPERTVPPCPVYASCGGCQWQHTRYAEQLRAKRQLLIETLHKVGGWDSTLLAERVAPVWGMETPWAYRNKQVTKHWIFTTLWAGPSLYDGLNPLATGDSDMPFMETDQLAESGMTEYEIDRHYRLKAWQFVVENPGRTVQLAWIKLLRFWKPWPNAEQFQSIGYCIVVALFFIPMVMFAILGFWKLRDQSWAWLLTAGPIFYFSLIHMVFVGSLRYRLPAEYPLCVLSAAGINAILSARKKTF